jgi:hypothetical protein
MSETMRAGRALVVEMGDAMSRRGTLVGVKAHVATIEIDVLIPSRPLPHTTHPI